MIIRFLKTATCLIPLLLCSCGKLQYQPVMPTEKVQTVHHLGAYSSQLGDEEKEVEGTLFQTRWRLLWKRQGGGWSVQRRLDTLFGRGYHKNSMPNELEKKANLDLELDSNRLPVKITGYDSLHAILARIDQREGYRRQLLAMSDTVQFKAVLRDEFRLRNLLPLGELKRDMPLEVSGINPHLETVKLDSARFQGDRPRLELRCLEYEVYYHRVDSLPLLVEQFFYSASKNHKWKHSTWSPGPVEGIWHFSMERSTGLPCFESLTETGHITLKNSEDKSEQPITLYRYEEDLYN